MPGSGTRWDVANQDAMRVSRVSGQLVTGVVAGVAADFSAGHGLPIGLGEADIQAGRGN